MQREKPRRRLPPRENIMTGAGPTATACKLCSMPATQSARRQAMDAASSGAAGKSEGGHSFEIVSEFEPQGDQPKAIEELVKGISEHERDQFCSRHRLGQDFHHGADHRPHPASGADSGAKQDSGSAALWRVQELFSA